MYVHDAFWICFKLFSINCHIFSAPTEGPSNIILQSSTNSSLTVSWDDIPCTGRNGLITGYRYRLQRVSDNSIIVTDDTPMTTVTISDLIPDTEYYFNVGAKSERSDGPTSENVLFQTMAPSKSDTFNCIYLGIFVISVLPAEVYSIA